MGGDLPGPELPGKSGKVNAQPERLFVSEVATPVGTLLCVTDGASVVRVVDWADCPERFARLLSRYCHTSAEVLAPRGPPSHAHDVLGRYFAGEVGALDQMDVCLPGTAFQRAVWGSLRLVPAGQTVSYAELARRAGRPGASRAAGAANGANPISVVVPCHRAIGSNGDLTGYAGGLARKRWLLAHESGA